MKKKCLRCQIFNLNMKNTLTFNYTTTKIHTYILTKIHMFMKIHYCSIYKPHRKDKMKMNKIITKKVRVLFVYTD